MARIGKKQRKEIVERFRRAFEETVNFHINGPGQPMNRYSLAVCICEYDENSEDYIRDSMVRIGDELPKYPHLFALPRVSLTEETAKEALKSLGFEACFQKNYLKALSAASNEKTAKRNLWGIRNVGRLIYALALRLRDDFGPLEDHAIEMILLDLFEEKGITGGTGERTIRKYLKVEQGFEDVRRDRFLRQPVIKIRGISRMQTRGTRSP